MIHECIYCLVKSIWYSFREREKKIEELKQEKTRYEEGMWNVNAVLMGGLGKDPIIAETHGIFQKKSLCKRDF